MENNRYKYGEVVSVQEAADQIGVSHMTIYRWIRSESIIYITFGNLSFIPVLEVRRQKMIRDRNLQEIQSKNGSGAADWTAPEHNKE